MDTDINFQIRIRIRIHIDATYTNTVYLTTYSNTRYWLANFRRQHALIKVEKFNHHARLRNVIERAYRLLKARFRIVK